MRRTLILGGPGTGKTTRLIAIVEAALAERVPPNEIALLTFTNAAADVARVRAMERFGLSADALPYFRTIHSLAFRVLGLSRHDVFGRAHLRELRELTGEDFAATLEDGEPAVDPLYLDGYARNVEKSLRKVYEETGAEMEWHRLKRAVEAYTAFRRDNELVDFTDMLERYQVEGVAIPVRVAIVDEAQDLTPLQWRVVDAALSRAEQLWVAGDDDQAVHRWAGSDARRMLAFDGEQEVLHHSHRLPHKIYRLAVDVVRRVSERLPKTFEPDARVGQVEWYIKPDEVDLSSGKWLLLGRTRHQLKRLEKIAQDQGAVYAVRGKNAVDQQTVEAIRGYETLRRGKRILGQQALLVLKALSSKRVQRELEPGAEYDAPALGLNLSAAPLWHEALTQISVEEREYYLTALRKGEDLRKPPRVNIETIHGAKGMEADNVLLLTDLSARVARGMELDPDAEHRVFYVGVTRAREALHIVQPQGNLGYPL